MYYKITNRESEVYRKLHELRTEELRIEEGNGEAVKNAVGDDWDEFLGRSGQQNLWRVTQYYGFAFMHPERLPKRTWKRHKEHPEIYVPDGRTKNGKKIKEFLDGLPHSSMARVFSILGCEIAGHFAFPFVEICNDGTIVLYMGDRFDETLKGNDDIIEITRKEFAETLGGDGTNGEAG